jgi:peptidoglycan/xylan/chitin deacetylase (PgdA/CDA1 family)
VIHANWTKFTDYVKEKKLRLGIGMLANSLEGDKPKYVAWLRELLATGQIELWLHAYDHQSHLIDGKLFPEFNGLALEEQKARLAKCQQLAREKLGQPFQTFGPPGQGGIPAGLPPTTPLGVGKTAMDENTLKAIADDPDLKAIMYPAPLDDLGARLDAAGKVTVLRRVFSVNLENPVFSPNFDIFLEGYAHNRGQDYFILQGHPKQWDEARFQQFVKIVDFLTAQGAVFVTPSELSASLKQGKIN